MRNKNDQKLGEVIHELIDKYHLSDKLNELNIKEFWEKLCGDVIARHTEKMYINKRKLFIKVDSAALRNELFMAKTRLLNAINIEKGENIIDDIIFL